ncbi:unnamed protein product [Clonostachys solani]|uniref:F-box domain-containing protein n=1 Tax=Clonostachys solani TaxID=160281 RepID=A0A9N9ZBC1_9HYPO|nr:unnamed protein product [Clonostachys solani]
MGHSEIACQICGVSFALARIRTPQEPPTAAWSNHGTTDGGYVWSWAPEEDDFDDEKSDGNVAGGCMIAVRADRDHEDGDLLALSQHPEEEMYLEDMHGIPKHDRAKILKRLRDLEGKYCLEHVAGPECGNGDGYHGNRISVEEMRTCSTMQGLVKKPSDWEPEDGDEDFERSEGYFLSGLVDSVTTVDSLYYESSHPKRHGCDNILPTMWYRDIVNDTFHMDFYSIAIHPACLETFKRATLHRYDRVDVGAFIQWWEMDSDGKSLSRIEDDADVRAGRSQWWQHIQGSEYLAANPCFVPNLDKAFLPLAPQSASPAGHEEIFSSLPSEIRGLIFNHLSLEDISNLLLASPLLNRCSQDDLRRRLILEWPWLWEAWSKLEYSAWVGPTARDLRESVKPPGKQVVISDTDAVNWGSAFRWISRQRSNDELKGLRNRQRIWKRSGEILDRIDQLRKYEELAKDASVLSISQGR